MDLFEYLKNLTTKENYLTEEETKSFQPFIINKWLFYSGKHKEAQEFNQYVFSLKPHFYYLGLKTFLSNKFIRWNYLKKPKKIEVDFFIKDIAKYYKMNFARAEEALEILSDEQKQELIKKFGYNDKERKKLGFNIIKEKEIKVKTLEEWW